MSAALQSAGLIGGVMFLAAVVAMVLVGIVLLAWGIVSEPVIDNTRFDYAMPTGFEEEGAAADERGRHFGGGVL